MKPPDHPSPSGDRTLARLLMEAMTLAGHEVRVMSNFRSLDIEGEFDLQENLKAQGGKEAERILKGLKSSATEGIDLWFTYHLFHKAPDWLGPEISKTLGIPYVVAEASYAPRQKRGPWRAGLVQVETALKSAAGVISLNPRDLDCIQPFLDANARQASILPFTRRRSPSGQTRNESKQQLSQSLGTDAQVPWLISIAMMRKGDKERSYQLLAAALAKLTDLHWRLIVIGDGDAGDSVKNAFAPLGEDRVYPVGVLEPAVTEQYLDASELFAWPAINEAFGMAMLEAHRHGLPVVAGYTEGTATIVEDQTTGFLTEPENVSAFAKAVRRLIEDRGLRDMLGKNAQEKFLANHTLAHGSRTLDVFLRSLT
ncbi:MAG: glycosyltransferase family 4 protein [Arenicellales bacterium]|jgi:glycosyltransferase involved in cell wall biosynthesis|nr:glycosyltransferase family 4 protein [Arenicellales bacterium]MDP6919625.1 glycosyltransferase family 4 protein [Arenicellales bacterium]